MTEQMNMDGGKSGGPVECFGMTYPNDDERREHFMKLLAEKLQDPAFRAQEGFPKGTDDAILAMSDPPYYTACPNPWLADFVEHYGKPYDPDQEYSREPMAIDVSVGKTDSVYKAHSYHTKVPHLAIVPSILHYTEPGDIILDSFAGTGMTGVAAQWSGSAPANYRHQIELERKKAGAPPPKWGARHAILNDLSPAATFIEHNYNSPFDVDQFVRVGNALLEKVQEEVRWMYETVHSDDQTKCLIEDTIWSEVFSCPHCAGEIIFLDEAYDVESSKVREHFPCPHCNASLQKKGLERINEIRRDIFSGHTFSHPKRTPSFIKYKFQGKIFRKNPSDSDLNILKEIEELPAPNNFPHASMMHSDSDGQSWGDKWRAGTASFTHVHHLYFTRTIHTLSVLMREISAVTESSIRHALFFWLDSHLVNLSIQNRYRPGVSFPYNPLSGVYYISSLICEASPFTAYKNKLKRMTSAFSQFRKYSGAVMVSTGSAAASSKLPSGSVDYIFTDPPFGDNLAYAELNFQVESFYGVYTQISEEAIVSKFQSKNLPEYKSLMNQSFQEYFRVLKPGRWMTVVFSNTKASVWNSIQTSLQEAGFIVADVSSLDKQQGSFNSVTNPTSVKQDLVISAYKPSRDLEREITASGGKSESVWKFVQSHLGNLALPAVRGGDLEFVKERDPRIVFDRMVAWFLRHGFPVPLSSQEFQGSLQQKFEVRDGMIFLAEQVGDYDKKRAQVLQPPQIEMFVSDERSAIDWLTDVLKKRPSTRQDLHTEFTSQLGAGWRKYEQRPELSELLEDNFLIYSENSAVPSQIHSYLSTNFKDLRGLEKEDPRLKAKAKDRWYVPDPNKAKDLEQKRERSLLKDFEAYKTATKRELKESRLEVLRAGFRTAWGAKDYKTIIGIAEKLPDATLQEDEKLLLWYDQALTRTEADA